jgi:mannan endo-1,4-beta-mannosidase
MSAKNIINVGLSGLIFLIFCSCACAKQEKKDKEETQVALVCLSADPADGADGVSSLTLDEIVLAYDRNIVISTPHGITLNEKVVTGKVRTVAKELMVSVQLEEETAYRLTIPAGAVKASEEVLSAAEVSISFRTKKEPLPEITHALVVPSPTPETVKLYDFLKANYGKKIISGTVANVHWNTNEADWVYQHTGKYPALNAFDYIHLFSKWVDYNNTQIVEDWWNNNGIVACMWHWNVPRSQGSSDYAFYTPGKGNQKDGTDETVFDISKAVQEGTYENGIIKADLEKIADRLLLLQQKNIPVIWRPLHEAAGGWFWWGAKGAPACKELWQMMFRYFRERGLNNLIWVWTSEPNDDSWYPGNEYVDIVGRDLYHQTVASDVVGEFNRLKSAYPDKIISLSECGDVAAIAEQWRTGARWSWFMPWYDFIRTGNPGSATFATESHEHADIAFWKNAFADSKVISREQMPSLK